MTDGPKSGRVVSFAPAVSLPVTTNERIPKMFLTLSKRFRVVPVPLSRINKVVYDQKVNKFARYLLFPLDELLIFLASIRLSKKCKAALFFAENAYTSLAGGLAAKILRIPLVWDNHGNVKIFAEAMQKSSFFTNANIALERTLEKLATRVFVVSKLDKDAYSDLGFDTCKFEVIPICADLETVEQNSMDKASARAKLSVPRDQKVVLFFGTLGYYPNLEAVEYIARELYPEAKKTGNVHFYIAGGGTYPSVLPEGVHHLGFVPFAPDLCIWLSAADVCIAPLWRGVGVLTKVVDMLSAGKPSVLSPLCLKGIPELEHGVNCLVGEDREAFTREVVRLLGDVDLQESIASKGKDLIARRYSWEVVGPRVWEILESIMAKTGRDR